MISHFKKGSLSFETQLIAFAAAKRDTYNSSTFQTILYLCKISSNSKINKTIISTRGRVYGEGNEHMGMFS